MPPSSSSKVDAKQTTQRRRTYLASLTPDKRRAAKAIHDAVRSAAPGATEVFSYGIPGFRFEGRPLVWYAAWAKHMSLYPIGTALRRAFGDDLGTYKTSRGTVQFPLEKPMPVALIKRLVKARIAQVRANERV